MEHQKQFAQVQITEMPPNGEAEKLKANQLSGMQSEGETHKDSMLIKSEE